MNDSQSVAGVVQLLQISVQRNAGLNQDSVSDPQHFSSAETWETESTMQVGSIFFQHSGWGFLVRALLPTMVQSFLHRPG